MSTATILLCTSGSAHSSRRKCSTAPHIDIKPYSVLYLPQRRRSFASTAAIPFATSGSALISRQTCLTALNIDTELPRVLCLPWRYPPTTISSPPLQYSTVLQDRQSKNARHRLMLTLGHHMYFLCHGTAQHHHFFASTTAAIPLGTSGSTLSSPQTCSTAFNVDIKPSSVLCLP
jgi:hypothetical protein